MHVHIGAMEAVQFFFYLMIVGFFIRTIEIHFPDSAIGKAFAFLY